MRVPAGAVALPMDLGTVVTRRPDVRSRISRFARPNPPVAPRRPLPHTHCPPPVQAVDGTPNGLRDGVTRHTDGRGRLRRSTALPINVWTGVTRRLGARSRFRRSTALTMRLGTGVTRRPDVPSRFRRSADAPITVCVWGGPPMAIGTVVTRVRGARTDTPREGTLSD
jgi:hypothetical protein